MFQASLMPGWARMPTARRSGGRVLLGYLERGSHRMVGVTECPVILPRLEALLPPLRDHVGEPHRWFGRWLVPLVHPSPRAQLHRDLAHQLAVAEHGHLAGASRELFEAGVVLAELPHALRVRLGEADGILQHLIWNIDSGLHDADCFWKACE